MTRKIFLFFLISPILFFGSLLCGFRYGDRLPEVNLIAVEMPSEASPGDTVYVRVKLALQEKTDLDLRLFVHLVQDGDIFVNADSYLPKPSFEWAKGEEISVGPIAIKIPSTLPLGEYKLRLGLFFRKEYPRFADKSKNGTFQFFRSVEYTRLAYVQKGIKDWQIGTITVPAFLREINTLRELVKATPSFRDFFPRLEQGLAMPDRDEEDNEELWHQIMRLKEQIQARKIFSAALRYPQEGIPRYVLAFADSLTKVFPDLQSNPDLFFTNNIELQSARNEYESFQLVVIPWTSQMGDACVRLGPLRHQGGSFVLPARSVRIFTVGNVQTKKPYYNVSRIGLWPDPLAPGNSFINLEPKKAYPFWVRIHVPEDAPSGLYEGAIHFSSGGQATLEATLRLTVWDFTLPKETHLKTAFELYPHYIESRSVMPGQKDQVALRLDSYYRDMLSHRISPIHNLGDPEFIIEDGSVKDLGFDSFTKKYDLYCKGLSQNAFSIGVEWPSQEKKDWIEWPGLSSRANAVTTFKLFGAYLQKIGALDKSYAYIFDETFNRVREVTRAIHDGHPLIKNLVTMYPDFSYTDVDIWCVNISKLNSEVVRQVKNHNRALWTYVSSPMFPYPSFVIDTAAVDYRVVPSVCWKYGIEGLLYWAVNRWSTDPWKDPMNFPEQNGNGVLYYPSLYGIVPSLRLEILRDGLEDYEYLYQLKQLSGAKTIFPADQKCIESLLSCQEIIASPCDFVRDKKTYQEFRRKIAQAILQLQKNPNAR